MDEEDYNATGGMLGFSFEFAETTIPPASQSKLIIGLYAEASQFDDATVRDAVEQLQAALGDGYAVTGGSLYQFAVDVPAKVLLDFLYTTLQAVPPALITSALYDVLKARFLKPKRASETVLKIRVISGTHSTSMHLRTSDSQVLADAMAQFREVALSYPQADSISFDTQRGRWILPTGDIAEPRPIPESSSLQRRSNVQQAGRRVKKPARKPSNKASKQSKRSQH